MIGVFRRDQRSLFYEETAMTAFPHRFCCVALAAAIMLLAQDALRAGEESKPPRGHATELNDRVLSPEEGLLLGNGDLSVSVYITNDRHRDADDLARLYDDRAGIETVIGDLKSGFGIGKHSSAVFDANEAAFLLKMLAYNLVRRFVHEVYPAARDWRMPWIRRVLILIPGRLLRAEGRWELRLAPRPMLN